MADTADIYRSALSNLAAALAQSQANLAIAQAELAATRNVQDEPSEVNTSDE